nr:LysR family transcriptional regulator [Rubricella aquisinus]
MDWKTLPSLTALRAFDVTARHGGFAGAARALNVTQAAVAQQVRGLEAELGVSLAVRAGRTVSLTPAGMRLAAALEQGFTTLAQGVAEARQDGTARPLRIIARPYMVDRMIVPNLAQFWQRCPGVEISLLPLRDFSGVQAGSFDLALPSLAEGQTPDIPGTTSHVFARTEAVAIAATSLVATRGRDLTRLPWLWHEEDMDLKLTLMRRCGLPVDELQQARIGSPSLQAEAVKQGIGVGLFNERIARFDIARGDVVALPLPRAAYLVYYAVSPRGPQHPMMSAFLEWLREIF